MANISNLFRAGGTFSDALWHQLRLEAEEACASSPTLAPPFLDHATGLVVGETAVIADDMSLLQGVTLGGTGKVGGDRHPKIGRGVMIGAGAKILGNVPVGANARIAAGSVLAAVPANATVAGVPSQP